MNLSTALGWGAAVLAGGLGWRFWGWQGVTLAITVTLFWLLMQFNRSMRVMREAAKSPMGSTPSAVMLHARLHAGMRLAQILLLTRSLGEKLSDAPETYRWRDPSGDGVRVVLRKGSVTEWQLQREGDAATPLKRPGTRTTDGL